MATIPNRGGVPNEVGSLAALDTMGTPLLVQVGSFDPTAASAAISRTDGQTLTLPQGARVVAVMGDGGATGGTNPTVDIGTSGDGDAFVNEMDADGATITIGGASSGAAMSADTEVYGGVGASAATGGTVVVAILYTFDTYDAPDLRGT